MDNSVEEPLPLHQLPLSPKRTFGYDAVSAANSHAAAIEAMVRVDPLSNDFARLESFADNYRVLTSQELELARKALQALDPRVDMLLDDQYLNAAIPRYLLLTNIAARKERGLSAEIPFREWLVEDDGRLLNFLQWHNHVIEQQSESQEIKNSFRVHKHRFLLAAHSLYDEGYFALPPKEIDDPKLIVGDIFDTLLKERAGYYTLGTEEVVAAQGKGMRHSDRVKNFKEEFPRVLTHEFVHLFLNRSIDTADSAMHTRWLNEALTEMISRLIRKKMDIFDQDDKTYIAERELLTLLVSKAPDIDDCLTLASKGFSGDESDRRAFVTQLDALWGTTDVLEKVNDAIIAEETRITALGGGQTRQEIETEAVIGVRMQLKEDPEQVLWATGERVLQNLGKVAQEK